MQLPWQTAPWWGLAWAAGGWEMQSLHSFHCWLKAGRRVATSCQNCQVLREMKPYRVLQSQNADEQRCLTLSLSTKDLSPWKNIDRINSLELRTEVRENMTKHAYPERGGVVWVFVLLVEPTKVPDRDSEKTLKKKKTHQLFQHITDWTWQCWECLAMQ